MTRILFLLSICFTPFFLISQEYIKNIKGNVVVTGEFGAKSNAKTGKMYLYEMLGNDENLIDSVRVTTGKFSFKARDFYAGVYRLGFNNATNSLDFVINPSEKDQLHIVFNNYRINKNYDIPGSVENKIKKLYSVKETSINSKIKLIKKSQKPVPQKRQEIRTLQDELFQYGVSLNDQWPGTYYGMILSHMQSPNNEIPHLYFDDIDFTDQCIVRSGLLPNRIQTYIQTYNDYKSNKYGFHDAVDVVMDYAKKNDFVAEFCMYNMLDGFYNTGQTQKGNDGIWMDLCNYIMDEYVFGEGCGDDIEPSDLLKERASQYKNLQLGSIPPNFSVRDMNKNLINLETVCKNNKYTVVMFWASHCQHCMAELPGFANWYNKSTNKNFEIVAIALDGQQTKWEDTVKNNNFNWVNICQFKVYKSPICLDYKIKKTPTFFVLNSRMEIVAKPKSTNQLRSFLSAN